MRVRGKYISRQTQATISVYFYSRAGLSFLRPCKIVDNGDDTLNWPTRRVQRAEKTTKAEHPGTVVNDDH